MPKPTLYRRRFIPNETVCLKDDVIAYMDDELIITTWKTLKPRQDFATGASCFFLKRGFKVSKFIDQKGQCIYHYCDIIETVFNAEKNEYVFNDLLVDVVVYPDGFVKVLDLAEIPEAIDQSLISVKTAQQALCLTDELLQIMYEGKFSQLTKFFDLAGC